MDRRRVRRGNLTFLFMGAYWLAQLCRRPIWAVLYVLIPASAISLDRMLVDLALGSLCLGFAVCVRERRTWQLWAIFAVAALCRESGFLLFGAYALVLARERRWREIAWFATALVPAIGWNLRMNVGGFGPPIPFAGFVDAVLHPRPYPFGEWTRAALRALDGLQFGGLVLATALGLAGARKMTKDPIAALGVLWACYAIFMPPGQYDDPFGGSRVLSPLLLFQWLGGQRLPLAMAAPRVWVQLGPQVWGVVRGLM